MRDVRCTLPTWCAWDWQAHGAQGQVRTGHLDAAPAQRQENDAMAAVDSASRVWGGGFPPQSPYNPP